jgi:UDPglucose 6-dehydrogenase
VNVCVFGCWHLGSVTAAGLASLGHRVTGLDVDATVVARLDTGEPPVSEPGLTEAIAAARDRGLLSFTTDPTAALQDAEVLWVTFDTPVDDDDRGNPEWVLDRIVGVLAYLQHEVTVLVSSQLPVGSTAQLERRAASCRHQPTFAYSPENLRLGRALESFLHPDRLVVGTRNDSIRPPLEALLGTITDQLVWMSVESAEMTKHALNAFLATSVAFTNEIATLCERVGADARDVERALRTDPRVGPRAYVAPGAAFAGGTLARDVIFLGGIGRTTDLPTPLLDAVIASNAAHRQWPLRTLEAELGDLAERRVAVLGLTYRPGTSTLRRSASLELCQALVERGAVVRAHDPAAEPLPASVEPGVQRQGTAQAAVSDAEAIVVATAWPEYRALSPAYFAGRLVVDADGVLEDALRDDEHVRYRTVGTAS